MEFYFFSKVMGMEESFSSLRLSTAALHYELSVKPDAAIPSGCQASLPVTCLWSGAQAAIPLRWTPEPIQAGRSAAFRLLWRLALNYSKLETGERSTGKW